MSGMPKTYNQSPEDSTDAMVEEFRRIARRTWLQHLTDWLFGYDFFVSYRWSDGRDYAFALVSALKQKKYDCFLDIEDYRPGENWVAGGRRALRKTTRLILICTRDAVSDPKKRRGNEDPIFRELRAFSEEGRQKIRIEVNDIPETIWNESEVSTFFRPHDIFLNDVSQSPSAKTLEDIDRGSYLEKRDRRRLRIVTVACCAFVGLALGLAWALYTAKEQYRSAVHNLGVSQVKEAGRLAGESRKSEAVSTIAQTLGLLSSPVANSSLERTSVLRPESEESHTARITLHTLLNEALLPQSGESALKGSVDSIVFALKDQGPVALTTTDNGRGLLLNGIGRAGGNTSFPLSARAARFDSQVLENGNIFWIDETRDLHEFDLQHMKDRRVGVVSPESSEVVRFWATPSGKSVAFLTASNVSGKAALFWKDIQQNSIQMLDGIWDRDSHGVFVDETHLMMCGPDPFPIGGSAGNVWHAVFYVKARDRHIAVMKIEPHIFSEQSGASYPSVACLTRLESESSEIAIGCSDGTARIVAAEEKPATTGASLGEIQLMQKGTLLQPPNFRGAITCITSAKSGSIVLAGTEGGVILTWLARNGQLLNASPGYRGAVRAVWENGEIYFSSDAEGRVKQWRDRPYLQCRSLKQEITDMTVIDDNAVEVLTADDVVHRFYVTTDGFVPVVSPAPDPRVWKAKRSEQKSLRQKAVEDSQKFFSEPVVEYSVTHGRNRAVVCFKSGWAELWGLRMDGQPTERIWRSEIIGSPDLGVSVAISPDDSRVAIAGYALKDEQKWVRVLALADGDELFRCRGDFVDAWGSMQFVYFANNGRDLVTGLFSEIYRWSNGLPTLYQSQDLKN